MDGYQEVSADAPATNSNVGKRRMLAILAIVCVTLVVLVAVIVPVAVIFANRVPATPARTLFVPFKENNQESGEVSWDQNAFDSIKAAFANGIPTGFTFNIRGRSVTLNTTRVTFEGDNGVFWAGSNTPVPPLYEQWFASLSVSAGTLEGHIDLGNVRYSLHRNGDFSALLLPSPSATDVFAPVLHTELTAEEKDAAEDQDLVHEEKGIDADIAGLDANNNNNNNNNAREAVGVSRMLGSNTAQQGSQYRMLRMLLLFNTDTCQDRELTVARNVDNMFDQVWRRNMGMGNFEIVYTCETFASSGLDRNGFAAAVRSDQVNDIRIKWGADLIMGIGDFTYTQWWRAGGDLGPQTSQSNRIIAFSTYDAAAEILVIPHEIGHCFGMDHERQAAFSTQGTYYCSTDKSRCNFGYVDDTYMTIMSYGTANGGCATPIPNRQRIYVYSGYPIPGSSQVLGLPCGTSQGAWNRNLFEGNWNRIADMYSSSQCPFVTCPSPAPAKGCICSNSPSSGNTAAATTRTTTRATTAAWSSSTTVPSSSSSIWPVRTTVYAAQNYNAGSSSELSVQAGDSLTVAATDGQPSWVWVRTSSGSVGYLPRSVLTTAAPDSSFATTTRTTTRKTSAAATSAAPSSTGGVLSFSPGSRLRIITSHTASSASELSVLAGEIVVVPANAPTDSYWVLVQNNAGVRGYVPKNKCGPV